MSWFPPWQLANHVCQFLSFIFFLFLRHVFNRVWHRLLYVACNWVNAERYDMNNEPVNNVIIYNCLKKACYNYMHIMSMYLYAFAISFHCIAIHDTRLNILILTFIDYKEHTIWPKVCGHLTITPISACSTSQFRYSPPFDVIITSTLKPTL